MDIAEGGPAWAQARRALITGTFFALTGAFLYGANIPAARVASLAGMRGADLVFYRALVLLPLLTALALALRVPLAVPRIERGDIARLAAAAGLTAVLYLSALDHLPVPMAVTIFYTFPLLVMLISIVVEGRRPRPRQFVVFAAAFLGLALAVGPSVGTLAPAGILAALLAALACAILFLGAGRVTGSTIRTLFWIQAAAAPIALVFALARGGPVTPAVIGAAPVAIGIAMGAFAIAFVFQLMASKRISASRTALLFLMEPVTSIAIAGFLLGEALMPVQILGLSLILAALAGEILLDAPRGTGREMADAGN